MLRSDGANWTMHLGDNAEVHGLLDSVDVTITDPPYSEAVHSRSIRRTYLPDVAKQPCRKTRAHDFGFDPIDEATIERCSSEWARLTRRWVLVFSDIETAPRWWHRAMPYVRAGVWVKDRAMPQISGDRPGSRVEMVNIFHRAGKKRWNGGGLGNVWQFPVVANCNGHRSDRVHTAQKPIELMLELVRLFSDEGETVLDSFAGSGTTGVACLRLGRRFIGIERKKEYYDIACKRLVAEENQSTLLALQSGQEALFKK